MDWPITWGGQGMGRCLSESSQPSWLHCIPVATVTPDELSHRGICGQTRTMALRRGAASNYWAGAQCWVAHRVYLIPGVCCILQKQLLREQMNHPKMQVRVTHSAFKETKALTQRLPARKWHHRDSNSIFWSFFWVVSLRLHLRY
jgi:hypothetical protein